MRKPVTRSDTRMERAHEALCAALAALNDAEARHTQRKYEASIARGRAKAARSVARRWRKEANIATLHQK